MYPINHEDGSYASTETAIENGLQSVNSTLTSNDNLFGSQYILGVYPGIIASAGQAAAALGAIVGQEWSLFGPSAATYSILGRISARLEKLGADIVAEGDDVFSLNGDATAEAKLNHASLNDLKLFRRELNHVPADFAGSVTGAVAETSQLIADLGPAGAGFNSVGFARDLNVEDHTLCSLAGQLNGLIVSQHS